MTEQLLNVSKISDRVGEIYDYCRNFQYFWEKGKI